MKKTYLLLLLSSLSAIAFSRSPGSHNLASDHPCGGSNGGHTYGRKEMSPPPQNAHKAGLRYQEISERNKVNADLQPSFVKTADVYQRDFTLNDSIKIEGNSSHGFNVVLAQKYIPGTVKIKNASGSFNMEKSFVGYFNSDKLSSGSYIVEVEALGKTVKRKIFVE